MPGLRLPLRERLALPFRMDRALSPIFDTGGGWWPLSLGSALVAWWDAQYGVSLSGSQVTAWADRKIGYSAVQGVSAARPIFSATSFGGAPGLTYDGVDDELTCTDAGLLAALPDGAEAGELWAVVQQDAAAADTTTRYALAYGNGSNFARRLGRAVISGVVRGQLLVGNGSAPSARTIDTVDFTSRHAVRGVVGATASQGFVDGSPSSAMSLVPATVASRLRLGAGDAASAGNFWQGRIRHLVVTAALSAEQTALLQTWSNQQRML